MIGFEKEGTDGGISERQGFFALSRRCTFNQRDALEPKVLKPYGGQLFRALLLCKGFDYVAVFC